VPSPVLPFALALASIPVALGGGAPPGPGEIAICEIAFNPGPDACVSDANGEYFEVINVSTKALDLNGVFFQDESALASGSFFVVPAGTLPTLFPGQRFLFARIGNASLNGGLAPPDYVYSTGDPTTPPDDSRVNHATMLFDETGTDGLHVTVGGPKTVPTPNPNAYVAGTEIDAFSFAGGAEPFLPVVSGTQRAAERRDVFFHASQGGGVNSANVAASTGVYGSCPVANRGTPGWSNSTDATVWPAAFATPYMDTLGENTGVLALMSPASIGGGYLQLRVANAPWDLPFLLGFAGAASETPLSSIVPGYPGAILLDLSSSAFLSFWAGASDVTVSLDVPPMPGIVGLSIPFQWIGFEGVLIPVSNGLFVTFVV
jgi:hypothetical protein